MRLELCALFCVLVLGCVVAELEINGTELVVNNLKGRDCTCQNRVCACCLNLDINFLHLHEEACVKLQGVDDNNIDFTFTYDQQELIRRRISNGQSPELCVSIPRVPLVKACIDLENMIVKEDMLYACVEMKIKAPVISPLHFKFGCFSESSSSSFSESSSTSITSTSSETRVVPSQ